jgi:hypothetical protein
MIVNLLKKIVLSLLFFIFSVMSSFAQCGPMMSDPCPPGSEGVPIDGGAFGLLLIGAIYGAKKIYEHRTKEN